MVNRPIRTVGELIEALAAYPPETYVAVHDGGHFGDYTHPTPEMRVGFLEGQGQPWEGWEADVRGTVPGLVL